MKKALLIFASIALVAVFAPTVAAEPHGITCQLTGEAKLAPGLTAEGGKYNVVFTGELSGCQSSGDIGGGTVKAQATAEGSCVHAVAEGHALIKWDNGNKSQVDFTTEDVGALVVLDFEITKSNDDTAVEGDQGLGALFFQADPMGCNSDEGIKEASFEGQIASGGE